MSRKGKAKGKAKGNKTGKPGPAPAPAVVAAAKLATTPPPPPAAKIAAATQRARVSAGAAASQAPLAPPAKPRASAMAVAEAARKAQYAQLFASSLAVMMRDPSYRRLRLSELEPLLLPAIASGQCIVAEAPDGSGAVIPVAVALWASLSPDLDAVMTNDLDKAPALTLPQWTSGDTIWLMALAGEPRALPAFVRGLLGGQFKGKVVKMRAASKDGKRRVEILSEPATAH